MDIDVFVAVHQHEWARLEALLRKSGKLTGVEADEVVTLYQRTATHLSTLQSGAPDPALLGRLSSLVARARSMVTGTSTPARRDVSDFFLRRFPAAMYRSMRWWGTVAVVFDEHGQPLDVGREQRLFTQRQRIALAERDGGCGWTACERPPSWCEAHHIQHWARDGGRTDVADGILLCRHHHVLLHDHHWEIERRGPGGSEYWLIPPPGHPEPAPRRLASKSAALNELLAGVP